MKLTFKKLSGEITSKEICFSSPISKSINRQKDLFYFIDLNDKDYSGYKLKCCKLSRIVKNRTDEQILMIIENQKNY